MKLENWGDLLKYLKELLNDDFNHCQQLVPRQRTRNSAPQLSYQTPKSGYSKVDFETKLKGLGKISNVELSVKQDGSSVIDYKSN